MTLKISHQVFTSLIAATLALSACSETHSIQETCEHLNSVTDKSESQHNQPENFEREVELLEWMEGLDQHWEQLTKKANDDDLQTALEDYQIQMNAMAHFASFYLETIRLIEEEQNGNIDLGLDRGYDYDPSDYESIAFDIFDEDSEEVAYFEEKYETRYEDGRLHRAAEQIDDKCGAYPPFYAQ